MENAFYFMLKALLFLKIFTFLSRLFGYVEKRLDKKAKVNFKIITTHVLPNISKSEGNQTIKVAQLKKKCTTL